MDQNETQWDRLLKIKTTGRDDSHSDQYRYPYEPTQYCVLERLAHSGLIGKKNVLLDYGTGKGRVCFYLSYQTRCRSIGVEYDERIFKAAEVNVKHAVSGKRIIFEPVSAEDYPVPTEVDRCYFFNPSSIIIGEQVNPASLGALLAHFENKVMFQGFLWNLNSFDQEGVQLGKVLAKRVLAHETDGALKVFSDLLNI